MWFEGANNITITCYPFKETYRITSLWARFVSVDGTCDGVDVAPILSGGVVGRYSDSFPPSYAFLTNGTDPCPGKPMQFEAIWCCVPT